MIYVAFNTRILPGSLVAFLVLTSTCTHAAPSLDPGPTYGKDYSGGDYNVTNWQSPSSMSPNHWYAAAVECENYCLADNSCCTWTYVTPEGGPSDPERCCLKNVVPAELSNTPTHWTGAAPRAATSYCTSPHYPGPRYTWPTVTNVAPCTLLPNWHDIAGALYFKGVHHVFQGCAAFNGVAAGWHHAISTNLVDWVNLGIEPGLSAMSEPYGTSSPCSGFVTVDDNGIPCAGFRECGGNWPGRTNTQVPLELRCASNAQLTAWSAPEYIFWFYFNRNLPYDPVRPWVDTDGQWYATISADACNSSVPCAGGGREYLFTSPALRGPKAAWRMLDTPLFSSNFTVLTPSQPGMVETQEFVTAGYFGNLPGDPKGGATRCVTNNLFLFGGTTAYFCGTQAGPGAPLAVDYSDPAATGMVDWGNFQWNGNTSLTGIPALEPSRTGGPYEMARTLSPDSPNQVSAPGRKIITAWLQTTGTAQALPRDLSLDGKGNLLQQFSPELQALRLGNGSPVGLSSQQVEVVAVFTLTPGADPAAQFGLDVLVSEDGNDAQAIRVDLGTQLVSVSGRSGPLLLSISEPSQVRVHVIVDHSIITAIVNNRTAITRVVTPRDADSARLALFGVDGTTIECAWQAWTLRNANITNV